jgi:hypothetical protein
MQCHAVAPSSAISLAATLVAELELRGSRKVPLGMVLLLPFIRSPLIGPGGRNLVPLFSSRRSVRRTQTAADGSASSSPNTVAPLYREPTARVSSAGRGAGRLCPPPGRGGCPRLPDTGLTVALLYTRPKRHRIRAKSLAVLILTAFGSETFPMPSMGARMIFANLTLFGLQRLRADCALLGKTYASPATDSVRRGRTQSGRAKWQVYPFG